MELDELLSHLPGGSVSPEHCVSLRAPVYGVSFLSTEQVTLRDDVLYFGGRSVLPEGLADGTFFNCVVMGADPLPEELLESRDVNLLRLEPDADPFSCYNKLQDALASNQEQTAIVSRMLQAFFADEGLQSFVDRAGEALGNPVLVCDPSYHYIARHLGDIPDDGSKFSQVMRQEMEYESILGEGISYIKEQRLDESIRPSRPFVHFNEHLGRTTMIGAVLIHGICIAHVMMVEQTHPFGDVDERCFARLVSFVGQEMQKGDVSEANKGQVFSSLLVNLLDEEQPSPALVAHRLRSLDFELLDTFYMMVIQPHSGSFSARDANLVASRLESVLSHNIYALYHGRLVLMFNRKKGMGLGIYTETVVRDIVSSNGLECGVSNAFSDLTTMRRYYEQARDVIGYGRRYSKYAGEQSVFHFSDYSYIEMFDVCSEKKNLMNYCQPKLLALMDYDERHHGELMQTLFAYLQLAGNTMQTAKLLSIHKNTLLYRMGRIREVIDDDMSSGEDMFMYHLSFRVLIYLGLFSPSTVLSESDVKHKSDRSHD
jgi:hypothetical protein